MIGGRVATAAVVAALVACACTPRDARRAEEAPPSTTALPAEQPVRGGTLVVALDADPGSLNPAVTTDEIVHAASEPMFNGLLGLGFRGEIVPELAESWTIEQDGAVYRFTLRPDVTWHDGRPFTSEDVKFTFERALLPFHSRARATLAAAQLSVEAPDPRTVIFRFPAPYAPLLRQLDVTEAPIIPKHIYEGCADVSSISGCPANRLPIGTGAFRLGSYDANEIRLVRNPSYFRRDLPYLDALVQRFVSDQDTKTAGSRTGDIDWVWNFRRQDVGSIGREGGIGRSEPPRGPGGGYCTVTVAFNLTPASGRNRFLVDERVRQALWAATDRQAALVRVGGNGITVPVAPIHLLLRLARATRLHLPVFDTERARKLLDLAGWKVEEGGTRVARGVEGIVDGTPFQIDFYGSDAQQISYGEVLRDQWRTVGVELIVRQLGDTGQALDVLGSRQFDMWASSPCQEADPFIGVQGQYHSSGVGSPSFQNSAGFTDPDMDRLWDESTAETEPVLRQQLFRRIQELAVQRLPYLWLAETARTRVWDRQCMGFNTQATGHFAEAAYCKP